MRLDSVNDAIDEEDQLRDARLKLLPELLVLGVARFQRTDSAQEPRADAALHRHIGRLRSVGYNSNLRGPLFEVIQELIFERESCFVGCVEQPFADGQQQV